MTCEPRAEPTQPIRPAITLRYALSAPPACPTRLIKGCGVGRGHEGGRPDLCVLTVYREFTVLLLATLCRSAAGECHICGWVARLGVVPEFQQECRDSAGPEVVEACPVRGDRDSRHLLVYRPDVCFEVLELRSVHGFGRRRDVLVRDAADGFYRRHAAD
jgi:hypothetical protein